MLRILGLILETILNFCEDAPEWLALQWLRLRAWESQHYRTLGRLNNVALLVCCLALWRANRWDMPVSTWWIVAVLICAANIAYSILYAWRLTKRSYRPLHLEYSHLTRLPDLVRTKGHDENDRLSWD